MKTIINKILFFFSIVILMSACGTDDMNYKDANVTAVNSLYEPADNKSIQLLSSSSASLYFSWEPVKVEDSGAASYEVVFDKLNGDFSKPIYTQVSDENGMANYATITHKILNQMAGYAGIENGDTGTVKWTVVASRGINSKICQESRRLTVTRLQGFSDIPAQLFITGEGSEGGTDLSKAQEFTSTSSGEFEIFTKLEAGKEYDFVSNKTGNGDEFYISGTSLKGGLETATVSETGVYRIDLDFTLATATIKRVTSVGLFWCPDNAVYSGFNFTYAGNGVFTGQGEINFTQQSWGLDQRYKFQMDYVDASGNTSSEQWGTKNGTDVAPNSSSPDSYYYLKEVSTSQWDDKWKLADEMNGATVQISLYFQAGSPYTHTVKKIQ